MPELPEVETTRLGIVGHILNRPIQKVVIRNPNLRWPVPSELPNHITGKKILSVERRGKYLLLQLKGGTILWHLGMSGSLRIVNSPNSHEKHDHIDIVFSKYSALRFNDPRRFGSVLWTSEPPGDHPLLCHLGPEPLSDAFNGDYLFASSRKRKQSVKPWIMDSKIVVGVGNIYANESLFNSRIHPLKPAAKLSKSQCYALSEEIKRVLNNAIKRGGTTLRDFVGGDGKPGYFAQELKVYGRGGKPCPTCGKPLSEKKIGQRSTVYCTNDQK